MKTRRQTMLATQPRQSSTSSSTQLSQLPTALIARILQQIPQRQRLRCCSLVCRAWRHAAAQATVHIECSLTSTTAKCFKAWLRLHGQQVQTLKVAGKRGDSGRAISLELPWDRLSRLQSLSLASIVLPTSIHSSNHSNSKSSTGSAAVSNSGGGSADSKANDAPPLLPKLRELQLSCCAMFSANLLLQLASNSPQLTSLVVEELIVGGIQTLSEVLPAVLKQLSGLVVLRLPKKSLSLAAARCVAAMHSLRELQVGRWDAEVALPSSLTWLNILGRPYWDDTNTKLPTQLLALTQLLHLHLERCTFTAAALASLPMLQHLHLFRCGLAPGAPSGDSNSGTAALLDSLLQLQKLQHLHLQWLKLDADEGSPQQWSALTASTQLTHLYVMEEEAQPLLRGAAEKMFPAGRPLPLLQTLSLHCVGRQHGWCLTGADLASIVAACPGLQELAIVHVCVVGQEEEDVSALLRLPPSCSRLEIGGDAFGDDAAAVLKQLTQLRSLTWKESDELTDEGLLLLADLTGLTSLDLRWCDGISTGIWEAAGRSEDDQVLSIEDRPAKGPVWQQLLSICDASPVCAAARARERMEKMAAENELLRQQLAATDDLRQQLADTQAQLAASQVQVQHLQQQLAAAGANVGGVE